MLSSIHRPRRVDSAREDGVLPLTNPILDVNGKPMHEIFVPKGTIVYVNVFGVNRDEDIWGPDATEWKPERFLAPLPETVAEARIPGVYLNTYAHALLENRAIQLIGCARLTFGGGNRACL